MIVNPLTIHKRFKEDFIFYAKHNLFIVNKHGDIAKFKLNRAQLYLHKCLEDQKKKIGRVRAIILKGRQQGCSTYVGARYFWSIVHNQGQQAYIVSHDTKSTKALFTMTSRFYNKLPVHIRPSCSQDTQNTLKFDKLESGYVIGTAGSKSAGRSFTAQYVHGSEVAFWPNGGEIARGLLQAVPELPNTEIILESTSDGMSNYFHTQWELAEEGKSDFQAIFIPWFWQPEYSTPPIEDFILNAEELELKRLYGLEDSQLFWRRRKIAQLESDGSDGVWQFKKEYPNNALEAFTVKDTSAFIKYQHVIAAQKNKVSVNPDRDLILGVDVARFGDDKTCMILRKGNLAFGLRFYEKLDNMQIAGKIKRTLDSYPQISRVYIDLGGGAGVYDRLKELGYAGKVYGVNFGSTEDIPLRSKDKYYNMRAFMWGEMRQWLADGDCQIPDHKTLSSDLVCVDYFYHSDSKIKLEKKEDVKKRTGRSPDAADALALTFANTFYDISKLSMSL